VKGFSYHESGHSLKVGKGTIYLGQKLE